MYILTIHRNWKLNFHLCTSTTYTPQAHLTHRKHDNTCFTFTEKIFTNQSEDARFIQADRRPSAMS